MCWRTGILLPGILSGLFIWSPVFVSAIPVPDSSKYLLPEVELIETAGEGSFYRVPFSDIQRLPNPSGSFEALLKTLPGVGSTNELSQFYSVRGGSFDDNLVYVQGIEVPRPTMIRSGQQEGLSFINPDMVSSVYFSPGGFGALYGDKMSSVLDVAYRRPRQNKGSVSLNMLGGTAHYEGVSGKFSYITGVRYRSSGYLLKSLDTQGDYRPRFFDIQTLLTYRFSPQWELSFLGNRSVNHFVFEPTVKQIQFGTLNQMYRMNVYYQGREENRYESSLGALSLFYKASPEVRHRWTVSASRTLEKETFDLEAAYSLNLLDEAYGKFGGDSTMNVGIGSQLHHARNQFALNRIQIGYEGVWKHGRSRYQWSAGWALESWDGSLSEWAVADSGGYLVIPSAVVLQRRRGQYQVRSHQFSGAIEYQTLFGERTISWLLTGGARLHFNQLNHQWLFSPRASLMANSIKHPRLSFHLSGGWYQQPPSWREMLTPQGDLNRNVLAQSSVQGVTGVVYLFPMWNRLFRFSTDIYYKKLHNLIPFRVDNIRLIYAGQNLSEGSVWGVESRLYGEFVPGMESWLSVSVMQARENVDGDGAGSYPMPTDQLLRLNVVFQDYLPGNDRWRVFLNMVYGTALPAQYPDDDHYYRVFRMRPYQRVDIGFTRQWWKQPRSEGVIKQILLGLEVFNLMDMNNVASYMWVYTVAGSQQGAQQVAVPEYLTSRRLILSVRMEF